MTDEAALLAAIIANPEEDTPRGVYADWLDENPVVVRKCRQCSGDGWLERDRNGFTPKCLHCNNGIVEDRSRPERAEFIRVQVELARRTITQKDRDRAENIRDRFHKGAPVRMKSRSTPTLLFRERELWDANGVNWLREYGGVVDSEFKRGFPYKFTCSWETWRTHAAAIVAAQPIERVRLTTPTGIDYFDSDGEMLWIPGWPEGRVVDRDDLPFKEGDSDERAYLRALWPRIAFQLPTTNVRGNPQEAHFDFNIPLGRDSRRPQPGMITSLPT